jgi:hypothetical protein
MRIRARNFGRACAKRRGGKESLLQSSGAVSMGRKSKFHRSRSMDAKRLHERQSALREREDD